MYAGIFRRSMATLIDIAVVALAVAYILTKQPISSPPWANTVLAIAVPLLYEPVLTVYLCTLGQALMGTRVRTAETLGRLTLGKAYKRFVLKYVASIVGAASAPMAAGAGRVSVWPHGDHRSIHDLAVGSVVINASAV